MWGGGGGAAPPPPPPPRPFAEGVVSGERSDQQPVRRSAEAANVVSEGTEREPSLRERRGFGGGVLCGTRCLPAPRRWPGAPFGRGFVDPDVLRPGRDGAFALGRRDRVLGRNVFLVGTFSVRSAFFSDFERILVIKPNFFMRISVAVKPVGGNEKIEPCRQGPKRTGEANRQPVFCWTELLPRFFASFCQ